MLSVKNVAVPTPRKTKNAIRTSGRRVRQFAMIARNIATPAYRTRSLPPLVVDEDRAAADHLLAGCEAIKDLQAAFLLHAECDLAALEHQRLALDPDGSEIAFADHGFCGNGGRGAVLAGGNLEG